MNSDDTIANVGRDWKNNPEPDKHTLDPQVILDCNIDGQAWLYHTFNESNAWLVYSGNPMDIVQ